MDGSTFDRLVRQLTADASRRGLLRSAFAGTLAGLGLTSVLGAGETEAAKSCKKKCKQKDNKDARKKCKKKCKTKPPTDTDTIGLRQPCTNSSQCVGDLLCATANSQNSCPTQATGTFCCVQSEVQAHCDDGCDCCGVSVICNGGFCDNT